jgi:hypothetical protein
MFGLFCSLFRLLAIWLGCHRIMVTLDRFPLRHAFADLNFAWRPMAGFVPLGFAATEDS